MISQIENQSKRAENIRRAFERATAESVQVVPTADPEIWLAHSTHQASVVYQVYLEHPESGHVSACSCPAGRKGLACKHSAAVETAWTAAYLAGVKARVAESVARGIYSAEARRWMGLSA